MEKSNAIAGLAALAHETRLDVFRLLVQAGSQGHAVGHIGATLGIASPTLSFHLSQLKQAGLIDCRREGRSLIYAADYGAMNALLAYLTVNCCAGDGADAICGPTPDKCRLKSTGPDAEDTPQ
jgi:ArsR family transcriptional regulator, arsenate/arsenite/antimonite-responsive transcriptional repressor